MNSLKQEDCLKCEREWQLEAFQNFEKRVILLM